jgi:uncharacterized protein
MKKILGHVTAAGGSQITACRDSGVSCDAADRVGDIVKVQCAEHDVIGIIRAVRVEPGSPPRDVVVIELFGELVTIDGSGVQFSRGVSRYPVSGAPVSLASDADRAVIFAPVLGTNLRIGALCQDPSRPAFLLMDPLLIRHFAVLGSTGSGKSCAATLILS